MYGKNPMVVEKLEKLKLKEMLDIACQRKEKVNEKIIYPSLLLIRTLTLPKKILPLLTTISYS